MVSTAVDATIDAVAVLKAEEGYRGKVLGPVAPATGAQQQTPASGEQVTGQFAAPSVLEKPQQSVNSAEATPSTAIITGSGSTTRGTRIVTGADGRQVMTNTPAPARSRLRRMTDALRITRPATP